MKLTMTQRETAYKLWCKIRGELPLFDHAAKVALVVVAKADVESNGDINAIRAALEAVEVES